MNTQKLQDLIPIPKTMESIEEKNEIINYLNQLDETQLKTYLIAMNHLGSSFNINRSNGFKEWKKKLKD
jgi:plasmid replication initiation protein